jgi:hypothetical protein
MLDVQYFAKDENDEPIKILIKSETVSKWRSKDGK